MKAEAPTDEYMEHPEQVETKDDAVAVETQSTAKDVALAEAVITS